MSRLERYEAGRARQESEALPVAQNRQCLPKLHAFRSSFVAINASASQSRRGRPDSARFVQVKFYGAVVRR
ncbi:hypothetical protein HYPSUDRAFT_42157 [Hypholoma sublateritium FD-334 SS-4]|uniref:Uncharacterized protein n=1 Tax=Hypholoma sublateritium (strain FD-334 SS-4) TaxID=945553 RepID=A0A0D2PN53_HYPSF|nr:hypothetical protein HYPSUDRAFT_48898 [Hypholoma sublateritium FD-334 SS-4]KJA21305.1 hypothetical protein HYPSUDRAFT_42157 [Hypholoma sublateritium FD-334 SS-4]